MSSSTPYRASDYLGQVDSSRRSADAVVPMINELFKPSSVLDVGCGAGAWLAAFAEHGVTDLLGLEGGDPDSSTLQVDRQLIEKTDLQDTFEVHRQFDLALSVEVAEHLPASSAATFVASIAASTDTVVFSAAIPGQGGAWHINEQWPDYWSSLFAEHGFDCFDLFRAALWNREDVEWWYRQNILVFARGESARRLSASGWEGGEPRRIIHPELWDALRSANDAKPTIRQSARLLTQAVKRRLT